MEFGLTSENENQKSGFLRESFLVAEFDQKELAVHLKLLLQ